MYLPSKAPSITSSPPFKDRNIDSSEKEIFERKAVTGIAIDSRYTRDKDDAIYAEKLENGTWKLQVHIADVNSYLTEWSNLDKYALGRSCTAYMEEYTNHMICEELATDVLSLNPNTTKATLSYEATVHDSWIILQEDVYRSSFTSLTECYYDDFDWLKDSFPDLHEALKNSSIVIRKIIGNVHEHDDGMVHNEPYYSHHQWSQKIVESFMLFANTQIAKHLQANFDVRIFRNQLTLWAPAEYNGVTQWHASLWFDYYTHFTSPIRRYVDIMVHRILHGYTYGQKEIEEFCEYINRRVQEVKYEIRKKSYEDKYIRKKRQLKAANKENREIQFEHMTRKELIFHTLEFWHSDLLSKWRKNRLIHALELCISSREFELPRELFLYLFLTWDASYKSLAYKYFSQEKRNNDVDIANSILEVCDKEVDESWYIGIYSDKFHSEPELRIACLYNIHWAKREYYISRQEKMILVEQIMREEVIFEREAIRKKLEL